MAHHEPKQSDVIRKLFESAQESDSSQLIGQMKAKLIEATKESQFGPTGKFPEGKITENDEGEIQYGITHYKGKVIINFGTPIASLGMTPEQAGDMALSLAEHANRINSDEMPSEHNTRPKLGGPHAYIVVSTDGDGVIIDSIWSSPALATQRASDLDIENSDMVAIGEMQIDTVNPYRP